MSAPKTPLLTTDCVILDSNWRLLLIRRGHAPFEGKLALPGGFVDLDETVDDACRREVLEETGIKLGRLRLIGVYSRPGRDPRGATCSIAYLARTKNANPKAGDDAAEAVWVADWRNIDFAFDHKSIIADAMRLASTR